MVSTNSDAWLNGRPTALHACSDLWARKLAVGPGSSHPAPSPARHSARSLAQTIAGIRPALDPQQSVLIGGHTRRNAIQPLPPQPWPAAGAEHSGLAKPQPRPKRGLQAGDQLLLSRPLGTGVPRRPCQELPQRRILTPPSPRCRPVSTPGRTADRFGPAISRAAACRHRHHRLRIAGPPW